MSDPHDPRIGHPLPENRFLRGLLAAYLAVFVLAAISPHAWSTWLLENLLVFGLFAVLAVSHRAFTFSNFSYLLIAIFLAIHAYAAHYTYSLTPAGFWLQDLLGLSRNHFDRFAHFTFGLLLAYPLREIARRRLHLHGAWAYAAPLLAVLALSSGYEILEGWAARIADPELGTAFLGTQGDEWDAQKDMSLALGGAALAMSATALYRRCSGREPWELLR